MEQEPVVFSATILDPIGREPVPPLSPVVEEPPAILEELAEACATRPI